MAVPPPGHAVHEAPAASRSSELSSEGLRARTILQNLFDLAVEIDASSLRPLYFSESHEEVLGYHPRELLEMPAFSLSHPDEHEMRREELAKLCATRGPRRLRCRLRHRDGSYRWFESVGIVYRADSGQDRIVFVSCDITDQTRAEAELCRARDELESRVFERTRELEEANRRLRESERLFHALAESSPVGFCRSDAQGRIVYANQRLTELSGRSLEETRGMGWLDALHPEDRERVGRLWQDGLTAGDVSPTEHRFLHRDGTVVWVWAQAAPERDDAGEIRGFVVTMADISDRKRAEEEKARLESRSRQQQRLEGMGRLARGVAHDFNNLLSVILGQSRLAAGNLASDGPAAASVRAIHAAADHAARITKQILTYSGEAPPEIVPLDLGQLVEEMGALLEAAVSEPCRLEIEVSRRDLRVEADPVQIRQLVLNLVSNASEALEDAPGRVTVRCGETNASAADLREALEGQALPAGRYVFLEVEDTGVGMDRAILGRVLEPYFTTRFAGRGLGLAAVLGIVRAHGGAICVESEPGAGTRFRVLLPGTDVVPAEAPPEPATDPTTACGRILVVDDDAPVLEIACALLELAGFQVEGALGGIEAVRILRERAPEFDAVVLDFAMPDLSGTEVLRELRALRGDLPVVMVSGYGEAVVAEAPGAGGPTSFLQKPYEPEALVAKLTGMLGTEPAASA
jgi:two-component system cell cycle sensor histidine kinase/response regulator CckA